MSQRITTVLQEKTEIPSSITNQCLDLYYNHYAKWSKSDPKGREGEAVTVCDVHFDHPKDILVRAMKSNKGPSPPLPFPSLPQRKRNKNKKVIGHIRCRCFLWKSHKVIWITQMVVHSDYRKIGVCKSLIETLLNFSQMECDIIGIISSNPYSLKACERVLGISSNLDLNFVSQAVKGGILQASTVKYGPHFRPFFEKTFCPPPPPLPFFAG